MNVNKKILESRSFAALALILFSGGSGSVVTAHLSNKPDSHDFTIQKIEERLEKIEDNIYDELKEMNGKLHTIDVRLSRLEVTK